jgi:hypothetical protein
MAARGSPPLIFLKGMIGKIAPHIMAGRIEVTVILVAACFPFGVPVCGTFLVPWPASGYS